MKKSTPIATKATAKPIKKGGKVSARKLRDLGEGSTVKGGRPPAKDSSTCSCDVC